MTYQVPATRQTAMSTSVSIFVFVFCCTALDFDFGLDSLKLGNVFLLLGSVVAILLAMRSPNWTGRPRLTIIDGIYLSYLALAAASTFWAPSPVDTSVQLLLLFLPWLATVFLSHEHIVAVARYVIHIAFITALLAFVLAVVAPEFAYQHTLHGITNELRGIFVHQLRFGLYVGIAIAFLIIARFNGDLPLIFRNPTIFYVYLPVLLVALVLAFARLYTFYVLLSLVIILILPRALWGRALLILAIAGLLYAILQDKSSIFADLDDVGFDLTLTGRTTIWAKTTIVADRTPIWGHGYSSFDNHIFDSMWGMYRPPHPHNSFLQAYFENGYFGYFLTVLLATVHFVTTMRNAGLDRRFSYSLFLVVLTIIGSLTGSNYAGKPSGLFLFMMLAIAIDSRRSIVLRSASRSQAPQRSMPLEGLPA